jgi:hypothetical protein
MSKEETQFQPGHPPHPKSGRPRGSKNKDTLRLDFWLTRIAEDVDLVDDAEKRLTYAFKLAEMILAKVQTLPATYADSVDNARQQALEALSSLESPNLTTDAPATPVPATQPPSETLPVAIPK